MRAAYDIVLSFELVETHYIAMCEKRTSCVFIITLRLRQYTHPEHNHISITILLLAKTGLHYKLAELIYRCLHCLAPPRYLSDYIQRVADSNRRRLRSSSSSQLVIRRTRLSTVGDRAFPVAGSRLWDSLPPDITSAVMLTVFPNRLKSYLFSRGHFLPNCFRFSSVHRV